MIRKELIIKVGQTEIPLAYIDSAMDGSEYIILKFPKLGLHFSFHPNDVCHIRDKYGLDIPIELPDDDFLNKGRIWDVLPDFMTFPDEFEDIIAIPLQQIDHFPQFYLNISNQIKIDPLELTKFLCYNPKSLYVDEKNIEKFFNNKKSIGSIILDEKNQKFGIYFGKIFNEDPVLTIDMSSEFFGLENIIFGNKWQSAINKASEHYKHLINSGEISLDHLLKKYEEYEIEPAIAYTLNKLENDYEIDEWIPSD